MPEARQARRPAPGGEDPEVHFRQADPALGVVGREPAVAGERHLGAAPETGPRDRRDHGEREGLDPVHDPELRPLELTEDEKADLEAFLRSLTGTTAEVEVPKLPAAADRP